jgi:hypothetical protein
MASCSSATHCSRSFYRTSSRGFIFPTISQYWTADASLQFVAHLFQFPALDDLWLTIVSFIQLSTFNRNKRTHTVMCLPWPGLLKRTAHRITNFMCTSRRRCKNTSYESEYFVHFVNWVLAFRVSYSCWKNMILIFFLRPAHILCQGETKVHTQNSNTNYANWKLLQF